MMAKIPVKVKRREGEPANVPAWLSDPNGVAPCICGKPPTGGEPNIVVTGEHNMRRWFHASCFAAIEEFIDDDDDNDPDFVDYYDDEDDDEE